MSSSSGFPVESMVDFRTQVPKSASKDESAGEQAQVPFPFLLHQHREAFRSAAARGNVGFHVDVEKQVGAGGAESRAGGFGVAKSVVVVVVGVDVFNTDNPVRQRFECAYSPRQLLLLSPHLDQHPRRSSFPITQPSRHSSFPPRRQHLPPLHFVLLATRLLGSRVDPWDRLPRVRDAHAATLER